MGFYYQQGLVHAYQSRSRRFQQDSTDNQIPTSGSELLENTKTKLYTKLVEEWTLYHRAVNHRSKLLGMKRNPGIKAQVQGVGTDTPEFQAKWARKCEVTIMSTLTKYLTTQPLPWMIKSGGTKKLSTILRRQENAKMQLNQFAVKVSKKN